MNVPCKDKDGNPLPDLVLDHAMSDAVMAAEGGKLNPWHEVGLVIDGVNRVAYVKVEGGDPTEIQIVD